MGVLLLLFLCVCVCVFGVCVGGVCLGLKITQSMQKIITSSTITTIRRHIFSSLHRQEKK